MPVTRLPAMMCRILSLLLLLVLSACNKPVPASATPAAAPASIHAAVPAAGPTLVEIDAKGLQALIASSRGKEPLLVNVWATWCAPCVAEFPLLMRMAKDHPTVRFAFLSTDFAEDRDKVRAFLVAQGVTGTSYLVRDTTQDFFPALAPEWDGTLPATAIFHRDGHRIAFFTNEAEPAALAAHLAAATAP